MLNIKNVNVLKLIYSIIETIIFIIIFIAIIVFLAKRI